VCILNHHSYLTITRLPHHQNKTKRKFLEESLPVGSLSSSLEMTLVSNTLLEIQTSAAFCASFSSWKSTMRLLLGVRESALGETILSYFNQRSFIKQPMQDYQILIRECDFIINIIDWCSRIIVEAHNSRLIAQLATPINGRKPAYHQANTSTTTKNQCEQGKKMNTKENIERDQRKVQYAKHKNYCHTYSSAYTRHLPCDVPSSKGSKKARIFLLMTFSKHHRQSP